MDALTTLRATLREAATKAIAEDQTLAEHPVMLCAAAIVVAEDPDVLPPELAARAINALYQWDWRLDFAKAFFRKYPKLYNWSKEHVDLISALQ